MTSKDMKSESLRSTNDRNSSKLTKSSIKSPGLNESSRNKPMKAFEIKGPGHHGKARTHM